MLKSERKQPCITPDSESIWKIESELRTLVI